jgi:putative aldouronate transport system permease protein
VIDERPIWMETPTRAERIGKFVVLAFVVIAVVYPFWSVLATSLATEADIVAGGGAVLIPAHPTLNAYTTILRGGVVTRAVLVSVGITVVGTLVSLVATTGLAYALSRPIVGGKWLLLVAVFTLFFAPGSSRTTCW